MIPVKIEIKKAAATLQGAIRGRMSRMFDGKDAMASAKKLFITQRVASTASGSALRNVIVFDIDE